VIRIVDVAETIWFASTERTSRVDVDAVAARRARKAGQCVVSIVDICVAIRRTGSERAAHIGELSQRRVRTRTGQALPPDAVVVTSCVEVNVGTASCALTGHLDGRIVISSKESRHNFMVIAARRSSEGLSDCTPYRVRDPALRSSTVTKHSMRDFMLCLCN
jgi:hypothetical protein